MMCHILYTCGLIGMRYPVVSVPNNVEIYHQRVGLTSIEEMRKLTRMGSMSGIREVAKRAGVSLGTVSNVLNRPEIVALETRQRVQQAIDEIGFVRNGSARQLRVGTSQHIGLIVLDVANPFFTEVARGVEDLANQAGYIVILCNSDDSVEKENHYLHVLEEQRTQGVIFLFYRVVGVTQNDDIAGLVGQVLNPTRNLSEKRIGHIEHNQADVLTGADT